MNRIGIASGLLVVLLIGSVGLIPAADPKPLIGGKSLEDWEKALTNSDLNVRIQAARDLGSLGPAAEPAVPALARAMKDKEVTVRRSAVLALGTLRAKAAAAVHALVEALDDDSPEVRADASRALALIGPGAGSALGEAVKDKKARVRLQAGLALWLMDRKTDAAVARLAEELKNRDATVRREALAMLLSLRAMSFGPAAKPGEALLTRALKDPDLGIRLRAVRGLSEVIASAGNVPFGFPPRPFLPVQVTLPGRHLPEGAMDALIAGLADKEPENRRVAAMILTRVGAEAKAAVPVLIDALKDKEEMIQELAACTLGGVGTEGKTVAPALAALLQSPNDTLRQLAAEGLATIGPEARATVPDLIKALQDKDRNVRNLAAHALGRIGPSAEAAVPALVELLKEKEKDPPGRRFGPFGPPMPFRPTTTKPYLPYGRPQFVVDRVAAAAAEALAAIGPAAEPAIGPLVDLLKDPSAAREAIAAALGKIGPKALPALTKALKDGDTDARYYVVRALADVGPRAVPALIEALKDKDGAVRRTAIRALGQAGAAAAPAVPALTEIMTGGDVSTRLLIINTLRNLGPEARTAVAPLSAALQDSDAEVRLQAAFALAAIGPDARAAVPLLVEVLKNKDHAAELRGMVARALGEVGPGARAAVPALVRALADEDTDVRRWAAFGLGGIGPAAEGAVSELAALLRDEDGHVRRAAARVLAKVRSKPLATADSVPEKCRPAIQKGLEWLVKHQEEDGHWGSAGNQHTVAITAFAGMALLSEGSTLRSGKYARPLRRATDWLLANSARTAGIGDGLLTDSNNPFGTNLYMFGHGYGMLFLAAACEDAPGERRRKIHDVLLRAVAYAASTQTSRGGWGYVAARDGGNFDEGAATVAVHQGLDAVHVAGIPVPRELLRKARAYLKDSTDAQGGVVYSLMGGVGGGGRPALTAGAIVCNGSGAPRSPLVKKWYKFCEPTLPLAAGLTRNLSQAEYDRYYATLAICALGDEGYGKLFPDSAKADRLTWTSYRDKLVAQLVAEQDSDGSWMGGGGLGPAYATAIYLILLQLDTGALPIQRSSP